MASPDRILEDQLKLDRSRRPLWYGVICGETTENGDFKGRFLKERVDFLANVGGFNEAEVLIKEFPLTDEDLPQGRTFYLPTQEINSALNELFGEERQVVRVVDMRGALTNPFGALVVMPCNSKRWIERTSQIPPSW